MVDNQERCPEKSLILVPFTPVVCLLGPRQCGKSTLSRLCEPGRHYVSLDDSVYLDFALADPQGFVDDLPEQVAIDEVQRAPELSLAIKRSVDANRKPCRSQNSGNSEPRATILQSLAGHTALPIIFILLFRILMVINGH